jgi:hypothetical protein
MAANAQMKRFEFWRRWLIVLAWGMAAFGLLFAFFNQTALFDWLFNHRVNRLFFAEGIPTADAKAFQGWAYGVLGAVLAGWAAVMALIAQHGLRTKARWTWRCYAAGVGLWFLIDTAVSLYFGMWFNTMFNVVLLVFVAVPLAAIRKNFH